MGRLYYCCFFLSLRTGSLIVGGFNTIMSLIGVIYSIYMMYMGWTSAGGVIPVCIAAILGIICIFFVGVNSCLIHGVRTGKTGLMIPWMVMKILWLVLLSGVTICNATRLLDNLKGNLVHFDMPNIFAESMTSVISILVTFYTLLVIFSQKKAMEEEANTERQITRDNAK